MHGVEIWGVGWLTGYLRKNAQRRKVYHVKQNAKNLEVTMGNYVRYIWCPDLHIHAMYCQRHLIWHK